MATAVTFQSIRVVLAREDLSSLAAELGQRLLARNASLVTVESCTGGWVAQTLTMVPGSSQWFECGMVTYSNRSKIGLAGVKPTMLQRYGAVSEEVASAMALGGLARSGADLSLAITGIAGPGGGTTEKPVGTVWFAWAGFPEIGDEEAATAQRRFGGDRQAVRRQSVQFALMGALERLVVRD